MEEKLAAGLSEREIAELEAFIARVGKDWPLPWRNRDIGLITYLRRTPDR